MDAAVPDVLARFFADARERVARGQAEVPLAEMEKRAHELLPIFDAVPATIAPDASPDLAHLEPRGFRARLEAARPYGLIAEIKRTSPSAGEIRPGLDVAAVARDYAAAGAACLSVLTTPLGFGGSAADLQAARAAVRLPVLRKDFIADEWQVHESRVLGADCILLIMAGLTDAEAVQFEGVALRLGMDVLAEVHTREELDRALRLRTPLIGINNRNLKTLRTDLATTELLAPHVPPGRLLVAESGIRTHADVQRLAAAGARAFLVGEHLLKQPDIGAATHALLGTSP